MWNVDNPQLYSWCGCSKSCLSFFWKINVQTPTGHPQWENDAKRYSLAIAMGTQNHEKWRVLHPQYMGYNPQKWRFWGSHGTQQFTHLLSSVLYPFYGIFHPPQDQLRSVAPSPTSSHAFNRQLEIQRVKVGVNRMSWNWSTIHVSKHAMLTLITNKSALKFPVFSWEIPSFESGCSSHLCLVYWSVKAMYQNFAKPQPYEAYVDVGVPKCQNTIFETNSEFTASLHLKGPKDHLQCFPLFVSMGAMQGLEKNT